MTKTTWLAAGLAGLALAAATAFFVKRALEPEKPVWTTPSSEALKAFERGLDSRAKFYWSEAAQHFARAVELDRDFAVAKLQLLLTDGGTSEERERWFRELGEAEIEGLSDREQFLLGYWRARFSGDSAQGRELLEAYLARHPEDPWAISTECELEWEREAWDQAEACYRRLIDMHPNWVRAQNRLGLIAMARGQFTEAEEHFRTYGYIAPDQAAPWDSLGQLLAVGGHYEKAEEAYRRAISIKHNYCYAHWHLAVLESLKRRFGNSEERLRELESMDACGDYITWGLVCARRAWNAYAVGDLEGARGHMDEECLENRGGFDFVAHRLAL
ncbi:MAG: tetratricopeptide repeat protein, partial [Acidobacteriota bacterium]